MRTNSRSKRVELLSLLPSRTVTSDPSAMTTTELAIARGFSESRMRKYLVDLENQGRVERCYKKINGKAVLAYRAVTKKGK